MDEIADPLLVPDDGDQLQQAVQDLEDLVGFLDVEGGGGFQAPEDLAEEERQPDIDGNNAETFHIPSVNTALKFINALKSARL